MYPLQHLKFGAIFSLLILFLFPQIGLTGFLIIFLSSVLIDVDHYLYYVYKKKDLSLKNAYKWCIKKRKKFLSLPRKQRNKFYTGFYFLHGIEILIVLFFLAFLSDYFLFVFIGVLFHLFLDFIDQIVHKNRIDKLSLIYDFFKFKKLKCIENGQ